AIALMALPLELMALPLELTLETNKLMFSFSVFFFICLIMKMLMLLVLVLMTAAKLRKKQKQIIWEYEHVGIFLELLDIELKIFTGDSADDNTGLIEMDSEWWDDREKEIQYAKKIRENEIPHIELMRRMFGLNEKLCTQLMCKMLKKYEQLDKSVPETQDNDGDHTNDVHHHSQTISLDSTPRSPIGPSKWSYRKQARVVPYESGRGKDVALSRENYTPRRRKSFEKEINRQFKKNDGITLFSKAKEHREKNEAQPFKEFKEAYEILKSIQGLTRWTDFWWACIKALQHCHGDPSSANPEKNIIRPTMESYKDFAAPSRSELMSLFEEDTNVDMGKWVMGGIKQDKN
ncbi:LOW QUALITY PROTEIN: hypothetical protein HID58_087416, partial [Brassica napus]